MAGASRMALVAATLGLAALAGHSPEMAIATARERADRDFYPTATRRYRKPTSNKHRGDARKENRGKNKAAKKARARNRK